VWGLLCLALYPQSSLLAQEKAASPQRTVVSAPFVGCKSDGQVGPREAPAATGVSVPITLGAAQKLAYYSAFAQGVGVLAPHGWYCFGTYGSGGSTLFVSPRPIDAAGMFSADRGSFSGPIIQVSNRYGGTSGRFAVAEVIARVFPAYKSFVIDVEKSDPGAGFSFTFGPYPKDALTYKTKRLVEYKTPPRADGLGTYSGLKKNGSPIDGVAMLVGQTSDLLLLSVRLPPELNELTLVIVRQFERDAERPDRN
jgi:hypothetical protein